SARTQPQTRFLWLAMHSHAERGNEVSGGFCDSLLRGKDGELVLPTMPLPILPIQKNRHLEPGAGFSLRLEDSYR
nr:hypothetical protein [Endozoicomonas sp.]